MPKLTIADIAERAGVSKATVSRVLNNNPEGVGKETRIRIQQILNETGFQPSAMARCLATGESRSIGLIIPDISNPFYPLLVRGAEHALNDAGYSLFLCNADRDLCKESAYIRALVDKRVDGVIIDSAGSQSDEQFRLLEEKDIPFILLDRVIVKRSSHYGVFVDNHEGAYEATKRLMDSPDQSLVFLNGPGHLSQSIERLAGVEEAVHELNIPNDRFRVIEGDFSIESGSRLITQLLQQGSGDAKGGKSSFNVVFAANDMMAIGAVRSLRHAGISVPNDVEVMGFDDIEFARLMDPPLSTVAQPVFEMGASSAELILKLISGKKPRSKTVVMKPHLQMRGTTRAR